LLLPQLENLGGKGRIIALSEAALAEVSDFAPTGLFWRCHAALVEHSELVLQLAKLGLPQISSFESLFIAGDKSFLTVLKKRDIAGTIPQTYVLSKNDLGVFLGKNFTNQAWEEKIKEDGKYQDITVFLADGVVRGIGSRVSDQEIVNVAQGGQRQAVVLSSEEVIGKEDTSEL
ncbi:11200_t:CDS:2, partial [Racocetra persica]